MGSFQEHSFLGHTFPEILLGSAASVGSDEEFCSGLCSFRDLFSIYVYLFPKREVCGIQPPLGGVTRVALGNKTENDTVFVVFFQWV